MRLALQKHADVSDKKTRRQSQRSIILHQQNKVWGIFGNVSSQVVDHAEERVAAAKVCIQDCYAFNLRSAAARFARPQPAGLVLRWCLPTRGKTSSFLPVLGGHYPPLTRPPMSSSPRHRLTNGSIKMRSAMLGHCFTHAIISVLPTAEVSGFSFRVRPAWRVAALDVSFRPHCATFVFSYFLHPSAREDPEPHWQIVFSMLSRWVRAWEARSG